MIKYQMNPKRTPNKLPTNIYLFGLNPVGLVVKGTKFIKETKVGGSSNAAEHSGFSKVFRNQ